MATKPENVEGRDFQPVVLAGGLDLVTSKFTVYPGSLQDCLNYESSDTGYTRSQGLLFFDGTYDSAIEDMWYVGAQLNPRVDAYLYDPSLSFVVGQRAYWNDSSGIVAYYNVQYGTYDYVELGLVEVEGTAPAAGDTIYDNVSGAQLILDPSMANPPVTIVGAVHPASGVQLANTIDKYLTYMNTTVNVSMAGQEYVPGTLGFHGKLPGVGSVTGGFQYKDDVYGVRDYYSVGFYAGTDAINNNDEITVVTAAGSYRGTVADVQLSFGDWSSFNAAGSITFKPALALAPLWETMQQYYIHDLRSLYGVDYICIADHVADYDYTEGDPMNLTYWRRNDVKMLEAAADYEQILNSNGDQVALVDTAETVYKGALWKATVDGWAAIDTGYTMEYTTGNNIPIVATTPLFLSGSVFNTTVQTSGQIIVPVAAEVGGTPLVSWVDIDNILADDAAVATCTLPTGSSSTYLLGQLHPASVPDDTVTIVGVEVNVQAHYTGTGVPKDIAVQLVDTSTGAIQYLSPNRTKSAVITGTPAVYEFGGQTDMWGMAGGIDAAALIAGNLYVRVQYNNPDATSTTVNVDYVSAAIHYVPIKQKAYVYNGTTDVAEVDITAFQLMHGTFGTPDFDATGYMTLYNVTDVAAIKLGMLLYTGPNATGLLLATVGSEPEYNLLPSASAMLEHSSKYVSIIANFREAKDAQGAYVATGASPAFMYEGEYFSFIHTPQWIVNDKPRHIAFHLNYLALGFDGSVIFSAVGVPNDFSGGSAAQYPTGGLVTGLAPLPGEGVLGVWTERRTMTLSGKVPTTDMALAVISDSSGALEYTVQDIGTPYFADFRGLSTVETTDKFGDFTLGRISSRITPFLKGRLHDRRSIDTVPQKPVASLTIRNKNQYRLYFQDGYIMTMTFFEGKAPEFTLQHYDTATFGNAYVPTFTNSYVLRNGRERNIMGTSDGSMWIVDGANGIQDSTGLTELDAYIVLNPTNLRRPEGVNKIYHVVVQGQFFGHQALSAWSDTNYIFDQSGTAEDVISIGSASGAPIFTSINSLDSVYASRIADGYSLKLQTSLNGSKPHTLQSLLFRASAKGTDRNRSERSY